MIDKVGTVLSIKAVYIISFSLKIVANSSLLFSNRSLQYNEFHALFWMARNCYKFG